MHQLIDAYDWIEYQNVVLTFAVIQRSSTQEVVRTYGGDPAESQLMTTVEAEDAALDESGFCYIQVFEYQEHVIALENTAQRIEVHGSASGLGWPAT
ncbi:hypothetical protein [Saccharothrix deserti]|uniref:hypothetical protein n=1 Tax=Saccharothrix deserti TaxID=2593674 RepID=UPI0013907DFD|nr:hypothetical protein [Saccharothrix deserti]